MIEEVKHSQQQEMLVKAVSRGNLERTAVAGPEEQDLFDLLAMSIGTGESSAIAIASLRKIILAIDDKPAARRAREAGVETVLTTKDLMIRLVAEDVITLQEERDIADLWSREYKFRLPENAFSGLER